MPTLLKYLFTTLRVFVLSLCEGKYKWDRGKSAR